MAETNGMQVLEFWNVDTGTTSTSNQAGSDIAFLYYNSANGGPNNTPNYYLQNVTLTGLYGLNGAKVVSYYATNKTNYAYGIPKGATIGTGGQYPTFGQKAGSFTILTSAYGKTNYGILQPGETPYIGFQFTATDGLLHDAWVQLQVNPFNSPADAGGLSFLGAAYNTTPDALGGTIAAGDTGTSVPEPGTLSALAAGAVALTGVGRGSRRRVVAPATV